MLMFDVVGEKALVIVTERVSATYGPQNAVANSREIVEALQGSGLLGRCTCPVGFGQVADANCPAHGSRTAAHTITGIQNLPKR